MTLLKIWKMYMYSKNLFNSWRGLADGITKGNLKNKHISFEAEYFKCVIGGTIGFITI